MHGHENVKITKPITRLCVCVCVCVHAHMCVWERDIHHSDSRSVFRAARTVHWKLGRKKQGKFI